MHNPVLVKVEYGCAELVAKISCAVFTDFPLPRLHVLEHIAAMTHLHNDVHELVVFENVEQPDDVRVLAHL